MHLEIATSRPRTGAAEELLEAYAEDWLAELDGLGWSDLARRQRGRLASLAFGAAGIAWAHRHAARALGDERLLAAAERWIVEALRRRRSPWAYHGSAAHSSAAGPRAELAPAALLYGTAGLWAARALIAHDLGGRRARERAIGRLAECCRRTAPEDWDFYSGTAGALAAVALLYAEIGGPRLAALGRELAAGLAPRVPEVVGVPAAARALRDLMTAGSAGGEPGTGEGAAAEGASGEPGTGEAVRLGIGHGDAGLLYGLLAWSAASGDEPPAGLAPALERLVEPALDAPERFCPRPALRASVCNGFSGLALLAARAHEVLGGAGRAEAACRAAALALAAAPPRADLCCGRTGVAYACLAAARVAAGHAAGAHADPAAAAAAAGWRRRAGELALSALLVERSDWEVGGLLGGEAGLVCLALDLAAGIDGVPPAFGPSVVVRGRTGGRS